MKNLRQLPKLRDSLSFIYIEHAKVERDGGALTLFDPDGETHVPAASLGVVMLGPGTTVTHEAMKVMADVGCSVLWIGDGGVRLYAQGLGETRSSVRLLRQSKLHSDPASRLAVVLRMYEMRFADPLPDGLTLEQIRGHEGVRVRTAYATASARSGVPWTGRSYDRSNWAAADPINRALSAAAACLNGVCHCAIVSAGYSPALGFVHTGKLLSFVYDVADLYRVDVIVPVAFDCVSLCQVDGSYTGLERTVRLRCRNAFHEHRLLDRVISDIDRLMDVTDLDVAAAQARLDELDDPPGELWDPIEGDIEGGANHDPSDC